MWGGIFNNVAIGEVDWDGQTVWSWRDENGEGADQSHDWARLPNGNTLAVVAVPQIVPALSKKKPITDEHIVEVSPSGEVVWRWSAGLHLDQFGLSEDGLNLWQELIEENEKLRQRQAYLPKGEKMTQEELVLALRITAFACNT